MIKNIIFDIGEVLLTGLRDTSVALTEKYKIEQSAMWQAPWANDRFALLVPLAEEFFHGNVSEDDYIQDIIKRYPQFGAHQWLKQHIRENFIEVVGTREIILELKKLDYRLALLSVHAKEWIDYCEEKFNFHELFDVRSYSYEEKVSKPHPLSFQKILAKLNAPPETCLFIDDSELNIKTAKSLGINGIVFTTAPDLRIKLRQFLPDF